MGYEFQTPLKKRIYQDLLNGQKTILAAAPGSGKTCMSIDIIRRYIKDNPTARILILTHGMSFLREQWHDRLKSYALGFSDYQEIISSEDLENSHAKVLLALPQTIANHTDKLNADFIIVDEAHHFYTGQMVQSIIDKLRPKHLMLLTGTPSNFLEKKNYKIHGITISETLEHGIVEDPLIELADFKQKVSLEDLNEKMDLKASYSIKEDATFDAMTSLLPHIINRLTSEHRANPAHYKWAKTNKSWGDLAKNLRKTMIACANQTQAKLVHKYFRKLKIKSALCISDVDGDTGIRSMIEFKENPECYFLIVVNRGILGFDFPDLLNVVDMTGSLNPDRIFQLLCRVVRKSTKKNDQRKIFIKLAPDELSPYVYHAMSFVVAMSLPEFYYMPVNIKRTEIPVRREFLDAISSKRLGPRMPSLSDLPLLPSFKDISRKGDYIDTYAYTDFLSVKERLGHNGKIFWTRRKVLEVAKECSTYSEFRGIKGAYVYAIANQMMPEIAAMFPERVGKVGENGLKKMNTRFTQAELLEIFKTCKNRHELKKKNLAAYKFALKNERAFFDKHLPNERIAWTKKEILDLAKKEKSAGTCNSLKQFKAKYSGAYSAIYTLKIQHDMAKLFPNKQTFWDYDRALNAFFACKGKMGDLKKYYAGGYDYLIRTGQSEKAKREVEKLLR